MTATSRINEQLTVLFTKQPCWMIEPLATELKYVITGQELGQNHRIK